MCLDAGEHGFPPTANQSRGKWRRQRRAGRSRLRDVIWGDRQGTVSRRVSGNDAFGACARLCVYMMSTLLHLTRCTVITPPPGPHLPPSDLQGGRGGHLPPAAVRGAATPHSPLLRPHGGHRHRSRGVLLQMRRRRHHSPHHQWQVCNHATQKESPLTTWLRNWFDVPGDILDLLVRAEHWYRSPRQQKCTYIHQPVCLV